MTNEILTKILSAKNINPLRLESPHADETYAAVQREDFRAACIALHEAFRSPVMALFAVDERTSSGTYGLFCAFESAEHRKWFFVKTSVPAEEPEYATLARDIFSASLFEREMREMFGISGIVSPDPRRLNLHDEVWPEGQYPLRKDFTAPPAGGAKGEYVFKKIEGEGVFEVPVGPVHAGIIGPGHFRFSAAGEPIIHLEIRLGFTHRGAEKLFEGKKAEEAVRLAECVSGDAAFAHGLAFCRAAEKIGGMAVPRQAEYLRVVFLELERMYNHAADIGGIALDVGFSYPNAFASVIKETILALNEKLTDSRYLKGVNVVGGVSRGIDDAGKELVLVTMDALTGEMEELKKMLFESVSFMDRVDTTGRLAKRLAEDLGVTGPAARASGIGRDLRKDFPGVYGETSFSSVTRTTGDVLARLQVRVEEFEESARIVRELVRKCEPGAVVRAPGNGLAAGFGLGCVEGWRGPVLYWLKTGASGEIERCKVTDPSFRNWQALAWAVQGNIIPDFPLCNKSFNLSYSGNDL